MREPEDQGSNDWSVLRWFLLGLAGIALAVAIALAAVSLVRQPVGLTGEPVSAGSALEPSAGTPGRKVTPMPTATNPQPDDSANLPSSTDRSGQHGDDGHHKDDHPPEDDHHDDQSHHSDDD